MMRQTESGDARAAAREGANLRQQYRPIGIGAVAAAMIVTGGRRGSDTKYDSGDRDDRAPQVSKAA